MCFPIVNKISSWANNKIIQIFFIEKKKTRCDWQRKQTLVKLNACAWEIARGMQWFFKVQVSILNFYYVLKEIKKIKYYQQQNVLFSVYWNSSPSSFLVYQWQQSLQETWLQGAHASFLVTDLKYGCHI